MARPGIEPRSPGPLVNTITIMPADEIFLPRYINESTNFKDSPLDRKMAPWTLTKRLEEKFDGNY